VDVAFFEDKMREAGFVVPFGVGEKGKIGERGKHVEAGECDAAELRMGEDDSAAVESVLVG